MLAYGEPTAPTINLMTQIERLSAVEFILILYNCIVGEAGFELAEKYQFITVSIIISISIVHKTKSKQRAHVLHIKEADLLSTNPTRITWLSSSLDWIKSSLKNKVKMDVKV